MSTTAVFDQSELRLDPGSQAVVSITVRNDSAVVESYAFDVVGRPAAWADVEPANITVYPGKSEVVILHLRPPRSPATAPGEIAFGVRVIPSEHPDDVAVPEGVITILPFTQTTAELTPRMSRGGRGAAVRAAIDNRGNTVLVTGLSGTDQGELLEMTAQPPSFEVEPGTSAFAELKIRPKKLIWRGQPITHPFTVRVAPEGEQEVRLDGTYLQTAVIPRWVVTMALAILGLIALLAVLWFTLLRPVIETAAKSAVADSVAQAADSAAQAAESAAEAAEATGQQPTTLESRQPRTIRLTVAAVPRNSATSEAFTVPADAILRITDIVFSNPGGDFGTITLANGDDSLFSLGLENFRDLDYHFQTPLELPANSSITARLSCAEIGTVQPQNDRQCEGSILISGSIVTTVTTVPAE